MDTQSPDSQPSSETSHQANRQKETPTANQGTDLTSSFADQPFSPKPKQKTFLTIFSVSLALLILIGFLLFFFYQSRTSTETTPPSASSAPKSTVNLTPSPVAPALNEFFSSKGQYSFRYPLNWTAKEINKTVWVGPPEEKSEFPLLVTIFPLGEILPAEAYPSSNSMQEVSLKNIVVSGQTSAQLTITAIDLPAVARRKKFMTTYTDGPSQTFSIQLNDASLNEYLEGYETILSSFEFLK